MVFLPFPACVPFSAKVGGPHLCPCHNYVLVNHLLGYFTETNLYHCLLIRNGPHVDPGNLLEQHVDVQNLGFLTTLHTSDNLVGAGARQL